MKKNKRDIPTRKKEPTPNKEREIKEPEIKTWKYPTRKNKIKITIETG